VKKDQKKFKFDAAGWGFYLITLAILAAPAIYGCFQIVTKTTKWPMPVIMGLFVASMGAGFITWAVNTTLQWMHKRAKLSQGKQRSKHKNKKASAE